MLWFTPPPPGKREGESPHFVFVIRSDGRGTNEEDRHTHVEAAGRRGRGSLLVCRKGRRRTTYIRVEETEAPPPRFRGERRGAAWSGGGGGREREGEKVRERESLLGSLMSLSDLGMRAGKEEEEETRHEVLRKEEERGDFWRL